MSANGVMAADNGIAHADVKSEEFGKEYVVNLMKRVLQFESSSINVGWSEEGG